MIKQLPRITRSTIPKQAGFTLVELLVALAIAAFVGLAIFELLSGILSDWNQAEVNSNLMADVNISLSRLGQDIRLAQNPNQHTNPVVVGDDNTWMDVYRYDENKKLYQRISYLVDEVSQDGKIIYRLKRGVVETNDPGSEENPLFGTIASWQTLMEGLNSPAIFYDRTGNTSSDRRLIEINISLCDKKNSPPKFTDFKIKTSFMSRSQQLNALSGEGGGSLIAVIGVNVTPTQVDNVSKDGTVFSATAQVIPSNASNQSVYWSTDSTWIKIDNPNSTTVQVTVYKHTGYWKRTGHAIVTTVDGGYIAKITISQDSAWSW